MVTFCHFLPERFLPHFPFLVAFFESGKMGVYSFFCISGFVVTYSLLKAGYTIELFIPFLKKRLIRIEPPYLFSVFMIVANYWLRLYLGQPIHQEVTWQNVLTHVGYINAFLGPNTWFQTIYWTLAIEFMFYLFIAVVFPLLVSRKSLHRVTLLCSMLLFSLFFPAKYHFPAAFPFFVLGMISCLYFVKRVDFYEFLAFCVLSMIIVGMYHGLIAVAYTFVTFSLFFVRFKRIEVLYFLGSISYSLYLTHLFFGGRFVTKGFDLPDAYFIKPLFFFGCVLVTIFFAWLYYLLIEKRCVELSKRISMVPKR